MGARFFLETQTPPVAGSREKGQGGFTDPPVLPAFPPRAGNIQAPLCGALPSSLSVGPAGDSPLPSGVRAVELQDRFLPATVFQRAYLLVPGAEFREAARNSCRSL